MSTGYCPVPSYDPQEIITMVEKSITTDSTRRWALVTGASAGIGAEFCRQLAARGYNLVLVARREEKLQELAESLLQFGAASRVYPLDLALTGANAKLASWLESQNIQVEFLVNNAGYGLPGHFTDSTWESHAAFIQVMVTSVCELTWHLLPAMQASKRGYIINVASLAGLVPGSAGHTLYAASKAFLVRFSESLALENHASGVRVSTLCPGFTYSEFHDVSGTRKLVSKMPSWMWMQADEVVTFGLDSVSADQPLVIAVPGHVNRLIARLMRWLPQAAAYWLTRRMSGRFRAQKL
jgi:short-subunit dehydrogenase